MNIILLVGGTSPEREVSKSSCKSIYEALLKLGHTVKCIDPAYGKNQPLNIDDFFSETNFSQISDENYISAFNLPEFENADLIFIGLHGKHGEDGLVQSIIELKNIKYTGSGILASSLSMDKEMSKILFQHYKVPTPKWVSVESTQISEDLINNIKLELKFPCIIKPNDQGSTVGLTVCKYEKDIQDAVKLALKFSKKALIEEYIPGHEVTVGILEQQVLPVLEIKPKHGLYDYECKYTSGMSEYIVPAQFPDEIYNQIQKISLVAFNALGCEGYGRLDFRVTPEGKIYCLEMNTLPGMTSTSLVPKMAKAIGLTFEDLISRIINLAVK